MRAYRRRRAPEIGIDHALVGADRLRRAVGDQRSFVEDEHAVADPHDDFHVVLDEQERQSPVAAETLQPAGAGAQPSAGFTPAIGSSSRIIVGIGHQHAAELDELALSAGHSAGILVGEAVDVEQRKQFARLLACLALAPYHGAVADRSSRRVFAGLDRIGDEHILEHRQPAEDARNLERPHESAHVSGDAAVADLSRRPRTRPCPSIAGMKPERTLNKVVLPAPFGPISAVIDPRSTASETSLTATRPSKRLVTLLRREEWALQVSRASSLLVAEEPLRPPDHEDD